MDESWLSIDDTNDEARRLAGPRRGRALIKVAVLAVLVALIVAGLAGLVRREALEELKHTLSLEAIIALVVLINLISLTIVGVLFAAYQWVRNDLRPTSGDDD